MKHSNKITRYAVTLKSPTFHELSSVIYLTIDEEKAKDFVECLPKTLRDKVEIKVKVEDLNEEGVS